MKRPISLLIGFLLVTFGTEAVSAQKGASKGFAEKTRYVYLWDVTGSTRNGLYDKMAKFLKEDLLDKKDKTGNEIYILPFNDYILDDECKNFTIGGAKDSYVNLKGNKVSEIDALMKRGKELVVEHNENYKTWYNASERDAQPSKNDMGFTNIAGAVKDAQKYVSADYNTIFILLTDGGQEYFDNGEKNNGSTTEAREWLREELEEMDVAMREQNESLNKLFYIIFPNSSNASKGSDVNDPRGENREYLRNLTNTEFINNEGNSLKIYLKSLAIQKVSEPNTRDAQFSLSIEGLDPTALSMLSGRDVKVKVTITPENGSVPVYSKELPLNSSMTIKCGKLKEGNYTLQCELPSSEKINPRDNKNTFVGLWFEGGDVQNFAVNDNFKPTVTVKIANK